MFDKCAQCNKFSSEHSQYESEPNHSFVEPINLIKQPITSSTSKHKRQPCKAIHNPQVYCIICSAIQNKLLPAPKK